MTGMIVAMTVGMMAGLNLGTILSILLQDFVLSTIVSVLIGMFIGYWTGKPVSLMASIDGMLAGLMGGMMGAMLGEMVNRPNTITVFVDIIFLFVILILFQMIHEETGTKKIIGRMGNAGFVTIVVGIAVVGLLLKLENNSAPEIKDSNEHIHIQSTSASEPIEENNNRKLK
ncbi:hypothetical protein [Paenibacillus hamazuiensis]|uniref:hypothetical protein n=1 Tax=Paenibacillus hamazuiensis TaxID=2936508 RepID=UPI0020107D54|nr:hypothetical protein [Paenibacillus hamazuiensis]